MRKRIVQASIVLALAAAILFVLLGWGPERKATVTAEPIPCFLEGDKLVCFDGEVKGAFVCEEVDETTVLCTSAR